MKNTLFPILFGLAVNVQPLAADPAPQPMKDLTAIMPRHGTVSARPASSRDAGPVAGNGTMGAMLAGGVPHAEIIVGDANCLSENQGSAVSGEAADAAEHDQVVVGLSCSSVCGGCESG